MITGEDVEERWEPFWREYTREEKRMYCQNEEEAI